MHWNLKGVLRWLVRARAYSNFGGWWLFGLDYVISIPIAVLQGVEWGVVVYLGLACCKSCFGYVDVRYVKRIQYERAFSTSLDPIMMDVWMATVKKRRGLE